MTEEQKRVVENAYHKAGKDLIKRQIKHAERKVTDAQRRLENVLELSETDGVNSKATIKEEARTAIGELESAKMTLRGLRECDKKSDNINKR